MIVVVSLHRDYLPSSWDLFIATPWDWSLLFGSLGLFLVLLFLFIRTLPMISIFEMREFFAQSTEDYARAHEGAE